MCKHVLYVLILFPAFSFSITGHPPLDIWSHVFSKFRSTKVTFQTHAMVFFQNYFYLLLFFLFSVIMPCFGSHKRKKEKRKSKEREKDRVSDSGWRCLTQGPSNKKQCRLSLMVVHCTLYFPMYFKWDFGRYIFSPQDLNGATSLCILSNSRYSLKRSQYSRSRFYIYRLVYIDLDL